MPSKVRMKCPVCKGKGSQTVKATEYVPGGKDKELPPVEINCIWCHGKGAMNVEEWSDYQDYMKMWCQCKVPGEAVYYEDEEGHGWLCSKCNKVLQTG